MEVKYHFTHLKKKWKFLSDKMAQEYLLKWSLKDGLSIACWAFNEPYEPYRGKELVLALLQEPSARQLLPWDIQPSQPLNVAHILPVRCSVTSLEFFDRILDPENGIVYAGGIGSIRGCLEDYIDGFVLSNILKQMILNEEHEVYELYSKEERRELIFKLMSHLVLGGQWCQYEDDIQPYLDIATLIYKDLLSVQKNKDSGQVEIRSICYLIRPPSELSIQNFAYAVLDPGLREITLFTHRF